MDLLVGDALEGGGRSCDAAAYETLHVGFGDQRRAAPAAAVFFRPAAAALNLSALGRRDCFPHPRHRRHPASTRAGRPAKGNRDRGHQETEVLAQTTWHMLPASSLHHLSLSLFLSLGHTHTHASISPRHSLQLID